METKIQQKKTNKYECLLCDYNTDKKYNLNKHFLSNKHQRQQINGNTKIANGNVKVATLICDLCGKLYKTRAGLWKHNKVCKVINNGENEIVQLDTNTTPDLNLLLKILEDNKELRTMLCQQQEQYMNKLTQQQQQHHQQITEMIPKIGNTTNNNTFNLQLFLDEKCKDAVNISDFIESLNIQMKDLEHTKTHGICEGVANIFVNGLKELGTYKRPIHCTDMKRETLYIKENDEWGKDTKSILKKNLHDLADKQRKSINEWQDCHPNWEKSEKEKDEWIALVKNVMGSLEENKFNENKIIRNIAKEVKI